MCVTAYAQTEAQLRAENVGQETQVRAENAEQRSLSAGAVNQARVLRPATEARGRVETSRTESKARIAARRRALDDPPADAHTPEGRRRRELERRKARKIEAMRAAQAETATAQLERQHEDMEIARERRSALAQDSAVQETMPATTPARAAPTDPAPGKASGSADQAPAARKRWWQFWR
jgi:hypothetical protein